MASEPVIVLYDLVFHEDRRPSPFCWRVKYALKHKGLDWREEPVGFTDKDRIAFADSQTVPVIRDGARPVKDSWVIALHLEQAHPANPLFAGGSGVSFGRFASHWVDTTVHGALFPLVIGDLYDRVRPVDQPYFRESRGKRLGTTDFAAFQAKARESGIATFRAVLEPARRLLREQPFLAGAAPAWPDYALVGAFLWARIASPLDLLAGDDPVAAWRERMLDLYGGLGRNARAA